MSPSDIRRLSLLTLTLLLLVYAAPALVGSIGIVVMIRQEGVQRSIGLGFISPSLFLPVVTALVIWGAVRRPDSFGRIFTPPGVTGAAVLGCAAIRVYCLFQILAFIIPDLLRMTLSVTGILMRISDYSPWHAVVWGAIPLLASVLLFALAPWIAAWVFRQVDSGAMWWNPLQ